MQAPTSRSVLRAIPKRRLVELGDKLGLQLEPELSKDELVERFANSRLVGLSDVLGALRRDELKTVCAKLGLNDKGRKKSAFVARLLGESSDAVATARAGMLHSIMLTGVGPAPELKLDFSPRLNIFAGDNGLGKSFLLDVAWWALTRTWARGIVLPHPSTRNRQPARIGYRYTSRTGREKEHVSVFDSPSEHWPPPLGRPSIPGLVLYAQVDGGFSVWDPARNYWKTGDPDRPSAYLFGSAEVWNGLPIDAPQKLCNGLIADWATWQLKHGPAFEQLCSVLRILSANRDVPLEPGELVRLSVTDTREHPTVRMPYGRDVPLIHASAGVRRVVALAYLLVWAWQEHVIASELQGTAPGNEIIFLVDEIEAHLHPTWQRRIVPALLEVMSALGESERPANVQIIAATHSPLVLASIEPHFDDARDSVFHFGLEGAEVRVERQAWAKQGNVVNWLVSDTFGLRQGRSLEAERAIEAAEAFMRDDTELPPGLDSAERIHHELLRTLPDHDVFWPRWVVWVEAR